MLPPPLALKRFECPAAAFNAASIHKKRPQPPNRLWLSKNLTRTVVTNNIHFHVLRYNHFRRNETPIHQLPSTLRTRPKNEDPHVPPALRLVSPRRHFQSIASRAARPLHQKSRRRTENLTHSGVGRLRATTRRRLSRDFYWRGNLRG